MISRPARSEFLSRLRHRPLRRTDVGECMDLLPPWLRLTAQQREALPALWERLADEPGVVAGVLEEMARPAGQRIQGWGATLIMPAHWLDGIASGGVFEDARGATLCRDTYAALFSGALAPPPEREIARSNAGEGIVFFAMHYRQRTHDMSESYALRVLHMAHEAFRAMHSGYRVRAFVQQALLSDEPWLASAGFGRRSGPLPGAPEDQTVLYGITREEAARVMPGSSARHIFEHQDPRFRLSAQQRRLLWLALFDESDEHLMARLDVSVHGLKKLWRGIYERIGAAEPEFFGESAGGDDGKRGPEKRRQVLAYVRQRPEELRPWL